MYLFTISIPLCTKISLINVCFPELNCLAHGWKEWGLSKETFMWMTPSCTRAGRGASRTREATGLRSFMLNVCTHNIPWYLNNNINYVEIVSFIQKFSGKDIILEIKFNKATFLDNYIFKSLYCKIFFHGAK